MKLWQICLFYLYYSICKLALNYPVTKFIAAYKVHRSMMIGYTLVSAQLLVLAGFIAHKGDWLIYLVPLFMAATNCLLWNSMHLHVSTSIDETRKGMNLATLDSLRNFCEIAAPLAGAIVVSLMGGGWLMIVASLITLLAIVPTSRLPLEASEASQHPLKVTYSLKHAPTRDLVASFGFNIQKGIGWFVWPIYLAVFLPDFRSIGIITTLASGLAILVLYVAARRSDRGRTHRVLIESTAFISIAHLTRIFALTPLGITLVSAFYRTAVGYLVVPWTSLYYTQARKKGINYIMSMEMAGDIAYIVMWSVLGVIAYFTQSSLFFGIVFGAAAVLAWLSLFMRHEKRRPKPALSLQHLS